ncbi:hypothetical protein HPB51_002673 [Rhipicephalus microplus]|uniref:Uncharacterized protein n=1 Tax=Rhipicephalus microplus TaxID=6941 RepID=A0A9J6EQ08_RHIMP|nr:hypothetical protein HPB51_002673 [Rhipicephalus microplus]
MASLLQWPLLPRKQHVHGSARATKRAAFRNPTRHLIEARQENPLSRGAERLLRHPKAHGVPMAVATSTTPALFDLKMSQHRDLVTLFQHVVCTGGCAKVKRGKVHPDIFLVAAAIFDEKPPPGKVEWASDAVHIY